ncbi:MAG: hypothetical protein GY845_25665 [Planctomycetes bacterium]|nr:hypothetical protein [Planctomycetota bacterium]
MATGDILSATILTNGWEAEIVIDGFVDGGTYDFGFTGDSDPTNAKIVFTVTSEGYSAAGVLGTIERTVYGTKTVRLPYPNEASLDETEIAGDLMIKIALSEPIYNDDKDGGAGTSGTNPTVDIAADWYTDDGAGGTSSGSNAIADKNVVNTSTQDYPKVIGNWAWPGFERATGDHVVECAAFHKFAQDGKPVACVKFDAADESAHDAATQTITDMVISGRGDPNAVLVYKATIPVSALDTGEVITVDFTAYPWVGDADSILYTGDAVNSQPTPLYTSTTFLCDKGDAFGVTVAYVDGVGAGTPACDDIANDATAKANPFATVSAAINAIVAYNSTNHSRANSEAGIIYLEEGSHNWTGASNTPGTNAKTWLTITKAAGAVTANVLINGEAGDEDAGARVKFEEVKFATSVVTLITNAIQLWHHNCIITDSSTALNYSGASASCWYITMCTVTALGQIYGPYATRNMTLNLLRGTTSANQSGGRPYMCLGSVLGELYFTGMSNSFPTPVMNNVVYAYNKLTVDEGRFLAYPNENHNTITGFAFIQNTVERTTDDSQPLLQIVGDNALHDMNNVLIWYNTTVGQRCNIAYNDAGSDPEYRLNWSVKYNNFGEYNIKTDIFAPANGGRIGNWACIYGVGYKGNLIRGGTVNNTEFTGLYCKSTKVHPPTAFTFVNDASVDGTDLGSGDYHLTSASTEAIGRAKEILLPYDLGGVARVADGAIGAYEYVEDSGELLHQATKGQKSTVSVNEITHTATKGQKTALTVFEAMHTATKG